MNLKTSQGPAFLIKIVPGTKPRKVMSIISDQFVTLLVVQKLPIRVIVCSPQVRISASLISSTSPKN